MIQQIQSTLKTYVIFAKNNNLETNQKDINLKFLDRLKWFSRTCVKIILTAKYIITLAYISFFETLPLECDLIHVFKLYSGKVVFINGESMLKITMIFGCIHALE